MNVANLFEKEIERCLPLLDEDEWALTKARQKLVENLKPSEAFLSISEVLDLALRQKDAYIFSSCCWLARQLAEKANTTEIPRNMIKTLKKLYEFSNSFGVSGNEEVLEIARWYRIENAI